MELQNVRSRMEKGVRQGRNLDGSPGMDIGNQEAKNKTGTNQRNDGGMRQRYDSGKEGVGRSNVQGRQ